MTAPPDAQALALRLAALDRHIAAAQAEQAALWHAIRHLGGMPRGAVATILEAVAAEWRVDRHDLLSDRRAAGVVVARHAACWLARALTPLSYPAIARQLRRDHTTVMHGVQAAELRIRRDAQFAERLAALHADLAGRIAPLAAPTEAA